MNLVPSSDPPLFVDLDGTLIRGDLLAESLVSAVGRNVSVVCRIPIWLGRGRAHLKRELASRGNIDVAHLPFREDVIEFLRSERQRGRRIVLATASDEQLALKVAEHLELFDDVLASNGQSNLKSSHKLDAIQDYCASHGFRDFAYVGDSSVDLPIWEKAKDCYVVAPSVKVARALAVFDKTAGTFGEHRLSLPPFLRALRPHQWVKNMLVFLPVILDHDHSITHWFYALIAFLAFCLCASAVYVLNDLFDIPADRKHPSKQTRPFASGELPIVLGPPMAFVLLIGAFGLAVSLSTAFAGMLLLYLVVTSVYSLYLKRKVIADVLTLAGLYSLRIFAGAVATEIVVSEWLAAFSFFLFTSLAFAKRYVELSGISESRNASAPHRGYVASDLSVIEALGIATGCLCVLVLALYINTDSMKSEYNRAWPLWLICPLLLYWIGRVWILCKRKQLAYDPILFAFRDRVSYAVGFLTLIMWVIASWPFSQ